MQRTPFYEFHLEYGAKFVDFAGWEMPILYRSIIEEHRQVRMVGGVFDVSHMGRLQILGQDAGRLLEKTLTRRVLDMDVHACRYSLVCNDAGGTLDDVLVYRFEDQWLLVVNASNRGKILEHLQGLAGDLSVEVVDQTLLTAMVAIQGPKVMEVLGLFSSEVEALRRYRFCVKNLMVLEVIISRTGYTGEDGVEIMFDAKQARSILPLILKSSSGDNQLKPVGLGARDTLRLEAGMPLYGRELDEQTDPISAGLDFAVSLDKEPFIGQAALQKIAAAGPPSRLVGLKLDGRRTPRQGMSVCGGKGAVGSVTSGCLSPTLGHPIAMAYVEADHAEAGTALTVQMGSGTSEAQVVPLPFYRRP